MFQNPPKKVSKAENTENEKTINLILKLKNTEILPTAMYIERSTLHCVYNVHSIPSGLLISSL